ncbi:MAG: hypothetical protein R3349_11695, partial [Geminicoccaceae bacterium]|nr:hypothetical protein [Geminicoccaceae bacterium]
MGRPSDVVLGLEVGPWSVRGVALTLDGSELGGASQAFRRRASASGMIELDPVQVWQSAVEVVHGLARAVPDLARRTVALGVTGAVGGLYLIDEDGEPVHPIVAAAPDDPARHRTQSEPRCTARLLDHVVETGIPEIDRAAHALDLRGWLVECLTGRPLRLPACAEPQDATTVQDGQAWLMPSEAASDQPLGLRPAAAAATGLWDATPVVVTPSAPVAAALAAGVAEPGFDGGVALLETDLWVIRPAGQRDAGETAWWPGLPRLRLSEGKVGGAALDWLVEVAQNLLAEAGLIGLNAADLAGLLEQGADRPAGRRVRFGRSRAPEPGPWTVAGIGGSSGFADIAAAIHEAIARSCREELEADGGVPPEVRLTGALASGPVGRSFLPRALAVPTRRLERWAPAATGAAFCALQAIGEIDRLEQVGDRWVEPFLGPPV